MRIEACEEIILRHVAAAMAAAAVPVPVLDIAAVTTVQVALVRRLARHHGIADDAVRGRAAVLAVAGASLARFGASAVKTLPGVSWLIGGATQAALSGASTYALGEVYRDHFARMGTLDDLDPETLRERYREAISRGRRVARSLRRTMRDESRAEDEVATRRRRLERLLRTGILTQAEFDRLVEPLEGET